MSLWQGEILSAEDFWKRFKSQTTWSLPPLNHEILFSGLQALQLQLQDTNSSFRKKILSEMKEIIPAEEIESSFQLLVDFISPDHLRQKMRRELGTDFPFELRRISPRENHFECWFPLGVLAHVTPSNSPLLNIFALVEGLLSGNINLLKLSRKDTALAEIFFSELGRLDKTGVLKNYIYIHKVSSKETSQLKDFLTVADVVSAWGNEESLASLKNLAPANARFVEWGHKISVAFITRSQFKNSETARHLAEEICLNEQQSCSSPQVVYLETDNSQDLNQWAEFFSPILDEVSKGKATSSLDSAEQAEITVQSEQMRLAEVLDEGRLIQSSRRDWRLLIENNPGLRASPLFRSLWVKPLQREQILAVLSPLKKYLQTLGLAASKLETIELLPLLYRAGFLRINPIGQMTDSYVGEPHDGWYALSQFCKKVSFTDDFGLKDYVSLEMIERPKP